MWVADLNGDNARLAIRLPRGGVTGWISDDVLLLSGRAAPNVKEQSLYRLSLVDGKVSELASAEQLRGTVLSPDGAWLAYYILAKPDRQLAGVWVMRSDGSQRYRLPPELFGAYQWRDAHRLVVVPFRPAATGHEFWQLDVNTLTASRLTDPAQTPFTIANGDWTVSPDGRQVALVENKDRNIWVLTLPE
jgi:hypothetical protein